MIGHVNIVHNFPFFSIFLAMLCGIITPLIKNGKWAYRVHTLMVLAVGAMSFVLLITTVRNQETFTFMMGHFPAPWGNELRAGPLEALMALLFSVVMLLTVTGGFEFIKKDILPQKQNLYFIMLNAIFGAMLALIYTNDLFTAYVFVEINTIASCALIMAKSTAESIVATTHYLIISLLGSGLFLFGVCILYSITGHLLMPQLQEAIQQLVATGQYRLPLIVVTGFMFIGLGIKSALFPFHSMLPGAYHAATPSSSGILSGLVLKSYIILALKLIFCVFSLDIMRQLDITNVLFALGLCGMVFGSLRAMKETRMKRMLAYSSVAQIGYVYMGIGMGTDVGLIAACFHIVAHAVTKAMLFICCGGLVATANGKEQLYYLRGTGRQNKLAGIGFMVGAFSMVGVPLFAGFVSKVYFATASVLAPGKMAAVLIVLAASMVLNALYFIPSSVAIWSKPLPDQELVKVRTTPHFSVTVILFICATMALGIFYHPVVNVIQLGIELLR